MNWANKVSMLRIFLVPCFVYTFLAAEKSKNNLDHLFFYAVLLFFLASLTDFIDGYLARNIEKETKFGKLIDPVADKLLITAALLCLLDSQIISVWIALLLIGRDIAIQGLRIVAASQGEIIQASGGGKLKTILQMTAIMTALVIKMLTYEIVKGGLFFSYRENGFVKFLVGNFQQIVFYLMWSAVIVSLYSAYSYFMNCKKIRIDE